MVLKRKSVKLPDCLPGEMPARDCWKLEGHEELRPEEFDFPEGTETLLTCKECGGTFYSTERRTEDYHYDELICGGCDRIILVYMGIKPGLSI